ncbi:unnamed protein product, partial [Mesorhabditis belari]|uniref:TraB domain-containing protein n=1 Tax=Mesorhabditis belari TaxID=2138241 RepID=A0AAF3FBU2_9BILA
MQGDGDSSSSELIPKEEIDERGQLTEEDIFRMKNLNLNPTGSQADPSIVSLADSSSNFDDHVAEEYDELEEANTGGQEKTEQQHTNRIRGGFMFERQLPLHFELPETVSVLKYPLRIPPCPKDQKEAEWNAAFEDATVYLVGTAHFSKESQEDVIRTIRTVQPDLVMIELCPSRISILSMDEQTLLREAKDLNSQKILQTIKQSGVVQGVLHVLLLSMSAHITRELSMAPGGEFRAAHKGAVETDQCQLILGDRPIQITLQRALASLSFFQKLKFFYHILISHNSKITQEDVEKCKQKDLLEQLLAEMAGDFPNLSKIFVDERDAYMTHALHTLLQRQTMAKRKAWSYTKCAWQPLRVVSVVGIGHMPGIEARWGQEIDIMPLIEIPAQSLSSKIIGGAFRLAFWGAIGYCTYRVGRAAYVRLIPH